MPRSPTKLPRMQNQPRASRGERGWRADRRPAPLDASVRPPRQETDPQAKFRKPLMRQYDLIDRVRRYNPKSDEALLNRAYVYAMKAHGTQTRASGDPYFSHPLEVAAILTDLKLDDATIAAALLHDTIEDTPSTRAEIDRDLRHTISGRWSKGSPSSRSSTSSPRRPSRPRTCANSSWRSPNDVRVLLIKLADRLHNMRTLALHAGGSAAADRRGDDRHLCAPRRPHGHARDARGAGGPRVSRDESARPLPWSASG